MTLVQAMGSLSGPVLPWRCGKNKTSAKNFSRPKFVAEGQTSYHLLVLTSLVRGHRIEFIVLRSIIW